eukprot:gnl/Trimastix_PCT/472.p1 GENE.gnl/Trimastix_PCT/472~~gnl/Trimastix_PCT/472.p1  ORF type:complete len:663 (-),score=189.40 gnl/Trimastix_PCT/472:126-2114(-)
MSINIGGNPNDPTWRYKMPKLQTRVEGKGNGIKTRFVNIIDVCKALKRPAEVAMRYFGFEFCAQVNIEEGIVNGSHSNEEAFQALMGFISRFVLCERCGLPETTFVFTGDAILFDCKACGTRSRAVSHRLTTYLIKEFSRMQKAGKKGGKQSRRDKERKRKERAERAERPDRAERSERSERAERAEAKEEEESGEVEWITDTSEEAVASRQSQAIENLSATARAYIGVSADANASAAPSATTTTTTPAAPKPAPVPAVPSRPAEDHPIMTLFDKQLGSHGAALTPEHIAGGAAALKRAITTEVAQRMVLVALERYVAQRHISLLARFPEFLMALYEAEVVEEDRFADWAAHPEVSQRYLPEAIATTSRAHAQAFLEWLRTAEEESDDDEEDEDSATEEAGGAAKETEEDRVNKLVAGLETEGALDQDLDAKLTGQRGTGQKRRKGAELASKYRELLGLGPAASDEHEGDTSDSGEEEEEDGKDVDLEVTFTPGLAQDLVDRATESKKLKEPEHETVFAKYQRERREKRKARRQEREAAAEDEEEEEEEEEKGREGEEGEGEGEGEGDGRAMIGFVGEGRGIVERGAMGLSARGFMGVRRICVGAIFCQDGVDEAGPAISGDPLGTAPVDLFGVKGGGPAVSLPNISKEEEEARGFFGGGRLP